MLVSPEDPPSPPSLHYSVLTCALGYLCSDRVNGVENGTMEELIPWIVTHFPLKRLNSIITTLEINFEKSLSSENV